MKKYPTPDDIRKMRVRGDDPLLIRKAEKRLKRWYQAQQLIARIHKAFTAVRLGNGVGLWEAQGLDFYASKEECAQYRRRDEKEDWRRIPVNDLNRCNSSLSFFDPEGMRFHLPAFLVADLQGVYGFEMDFQLTHLSDYSIEQFSLLNEAQRHIIHDVALHLAGDEDYRFGRQKLLKAAHTYWSEPFNSKQR